MSSAGAGGTSGPRPRLLLPILLAAWAVAILVWFFVLNPFPVRPAQLATVGRDLLGATLMLAVAAVAGRGLLRLSGLEARMGEPGERLLHGTALGYGALCLGGLGFALLGWLRPLPLSLAGLAILATGGAAARAVLRDLGALRRHRAAAPRLPAARLLGIALAVAMALMLLEALAPPTAYDALRYHLRLPRIYADAGGLVEVPFDFNGAFPQNVGMLFAVAMAVRATGAAGLTHLFLGWLAAAAVARLAMRAAGPSAGLPAAAVFYTMPVVALNSGWAYVDMGLALFTLLGVHAAWEWRREGGTDRAVLAGIYAGLALGTKYTGAAVLLVLPLWIAARPLRRAGGVSWRRALGAALLAASVGLAVASPWLIRNQARHGNPVYPFASSWFGTAPGDTYRAERHRAVLERPEVPAGSPGELLRLPWRFSIDPWVRDELIGPALLVLLPALLLARGGGAGGLVGLAAIFAALWIATSPQVRLFVHGLGLLAAAGGAAWAELARRGGGLSRVVSWAATAAVFLALLNLAVLQRGLSDPFPVVAGMESREHYLRRMVDGHEAIEFLNRELPPGSRVLFVGEIFGYYCRVPYLLGSKFDRPPLVARIASSSDVPDLLARLRGEGFTHVLYSIVQLRRFAELPGRYLDWPDDRSRTIYREFMTRHLEPVFESPDAVVSRILDEPRRSPPPPEPAAAPDP